MIKSVFPRLFGQYMEGQIITARWQHTAAGSVWTRISTDRQTSHNDISVADRGTGLLTITVPKGRVATVLGMHIEPLGDLIANVFQVHSRLLTPTSGSFQAVITDLAATPAVIDPPDAAILVINYYLGK